MATFTASLSIVKELRRLASIQTNRPYMLRNDVNSLLVFTDPDEQPREVVIHALHALRFLAHEALKNENQLSAFQNTVGLLELLEKINSKEKYDPGCTKLSSELLFLIKCNARSTHPAASDKKAATGVMTRAGLRSARRNKEPVKFLGGNKKAKVIVLQIDGLTSDERKQECINELLRVTGVVSITFNMNLQRSTIRARSDMHVESLIHAINNTRKMSAKQVIRNESGEEVLLSFDGLNNTDIWAKSWKTSMGSILARDSSVELPAYLEEEVESPMKDEERRSVARPGHIEAVGSFARSWLGSVVTAVNKNLYW